MITTQSNKKTGIILKFQISSSFTSQTLLLKISVIRILDLINSKENERER